ncbi:PREDICTED: uncharacterized protein LOC105449753 [Wasmannia auropunctata]|uniref:uncharacterized protein LOC105449753 n=1 Tax=Wasmannia auropunctata TaxID=64793 RepID=UPI0005EEFB26|nr:PREDICTED: uncharacterized protein LOC105449753 [Wasmannia auropunctata]
MKGTGDSAKIRVVFNGSSRTNSGTSLNNWLRAGPNLLPALSDVLTRWRHHRFVLATDIEKMYRQISVHPEDRDLQRILWGMEEITEHQLNTVTYGLACAPFLAIRVLHQLADDEGDRFPLGAEAVRCDTYVDDILSDAPTLAGAQRLREQLTWLCTAGGFPLRKWSANHDQILQGVPREHCSQGATDTILPSAAQSILGLRWDHEIDCFAPTVRTMPPGQETKRSLLSGTARLFDPLGWLAPVTVRAKLLIQATWLQQLDWDAPLAEEESTAWARMKDELPLLEGIRVPRWMQSDQPGASVEVHGFSDASERAYAAVVHLRTTCAESERTSLVLAKTRVAPLRRVSLPRLKLCAAALLAKLVAHTRATLTLTRAPTFMWTDSTVVLGWIRGPPRQVDNLRRQQGRRGASPGDGCPVAARARTRQSGGLCIQGVSPRELLSHPLWWQGPGFLRQESSSWGAGGCGDRGPPGATDDPAHRRD